MKYNQYLGYTSKQYLLSYYVKKILYYSDYRSESQYLDFGFKGCFKHKISVVYYEQEAYKLS